MKTVTAQAVVLTAVLMSLAPALSAQWPNQPTPDVPKTAAGVPALTGPVPRTPDGKPDLSGLWRGAGGVGGGQTAPAVPEGTPPVAGFRNVGSGFKEGLPLTPLGADLLKARVANNSKDNPEAHCLPMGIVQLHTQGAPRKFIQTPRLLVVLYEASMETRQIHLDGRKYPTEDAQPWWYGYSAGRWEGDTLVVETKHFREGGWLDIIGTPLTDAATITERFRRVNFGRMEIDVTVNDPKAYTRPWTVRVNQQLMLDEDLIEFVCLENQRFGKQ